MTEEFSEYQNFLKQAGTEDPFLAERLRRDTERQNKIVAEAHEKQLKRVLDARKAEQEKQEAAKRAREKKLEEEAAAATAKAKAEERKAYLLAGGDPKLFDDFWKGRHEEIIAERMAERRRLTVSVKSYL